ncbi:hypothetical protein BHM03_00049781 [Ensete ventricosum]|nr:hypothetical protein BHM03_00049781 [Ensete ventricosum]
MIVLFSKGCPSPLPLPSLHRHRRHCPAQVEAGAAALGRHLAGGRCRLARALPLQKRLPVQAAALVAGLPLAASQRAAALTATSATYARRHRPYRGQPCLRAAAHVGGYPCKGLWLWPVAPLQGALVAASCPMQPAWSWVADPAWGLAVAGRPSSLLPSLRKRSKNA